MTITASQVKDLRQRTGAGMMECKRALKETEGDLDKAIEFLRTKGLAAADKKAGRATSEGRVGSYIHSNGKLGVLVEVACETDFVAKTEQFQEFVRNLAMHVAASDPICVDENQVPEDYINQERKIIKAQIAEDPKMADKPDEMIAKIIEGKIKKIYKEQVLLNQPYVKDPDRTVDSYVKSMIASLGENMSVRRFSRLNLGEEV